MDSFFFFCLSSSLFPPSLFQQDFKAWLGFNPYQIPNFYSITLFLFFPFFPLCCTSFPLLSVCPLMSSPLFPCLSSFFLSPILYPSFFFFFLFLLSFFPFLLLFFLSFLRSLLSYRISNWFTHVQVRKSLN